VRKLLVVLVVLVIAAVALFVGAGFAAGPEIVITKPEKFVGARTRVEAVVKGPNVVLTSVSVVFEQNGRRTGLGGPEDGLDPGTPEPGTVTKIAEIDRKAVPDLQSGPAKLIVTATRPVLFGLRNIGAEATRDVQVRLEQPRVSVLSSHHYINQGGAEFVVYRVSPDDVESGARVGDMEYPGFAASAIRVDGAAIADPAVRVAFFALLHDQPVNAPMHVFARDEAGNTARAELDRRTFPKAFKKSRIEIADTLLDRVVPAILAGTTDVKPEGAPIDKFLVINRELRRKNAEKIASFAKDTAPELLWNGVVFHPFTNTSAESAFADDRTYLYQGREVDRQTHLGFDLASFAGTPIVAANRGKVLFADNLGIYGQAVIIDHGLGVQSLYGHLSSIDVRPGAIVEKGQPIGRSGMTGLAGGDHLHFTMLVNGRMVNPIEWWDAHWIEDRVLRKLRAAK
jgi:murein DD-endopeptidase MepM/ murein hydrolase activator NlpD